MNKLFGIYSKITPILLDYQSGLTTAKNEVMTYIKFLVNSIAIPVVSAALVVVLIFAIVSAVNLKRQGEDYSGKIKAIVIVVAVIVLITTAPLWVWDVAGV